MKIQIPEKANEIITTLTAAGYEAYVVGGCVRDAILGREAADWDITTNARPEQVKALFPRTVDTGLQHGTVTVLNGKEGFEVTTYRIDGEYLDGRHPEQVLFTPNLLEDLKRRDFTINAMAYNEKEGLVDAFGGIGDLERGQIRCVGDPRERFTEDALRILRAVRFSAQLDFEIEAETKAALAEFAPRLTKVSAERIQVELMKLLTSDHPEVFRVVWETGITAVILPEFDACMETPQHNPHHCWNVGEHILRTLTGVEKDKALRWAALLHDMGKPATRTTDEQGIDHFHGHAKLGAEMANGILRRLKFDNDTRKRVVRLVEFHDAPGHSPDWRGSVSGLSEACPGGCAGPESGAAAGEACAAVRNRASVYRDTGSPKLPVPKGSGRDRPRSHRCGREAGTDLGSHPERHAGGRYRAPGIQYKRISLRKNITPRFLIDLKGTGGFL